MFVCFEQFKQSLKTFLGVRSRRIADFAEFFTDKIDSVRMSTSTTPLYSVAHSATSTLDTWPAVTTDEVAKLIDSAVNKTCQLYPVGPVPTWLVKEVRGLLSPFITLLSNKSLTTGCFTSDFKLAVVSGLGLGVRGYARPCLGYVPHRLLQRELAGAPKAKPTTDKLQRLLNAAARLVSDATKFDRGLSQFMHVDGPSLARRTGASEVQTRSSLPDGLLHSHLRYSQSTTSSFRQSSSPGCAATQSQHVW